jgi:PAS domain S-box-containing protein
MKHNGHYSAGSAGPEKANILLVDDRPDKLLAMESVLASLDQNLVKAHSGKEALRLLLQKEFAVILLDVNMPGMDGFETAQLIRQRPLNEHTPIIFVTSINDSPNQIASGYALGAVDYILAPIAPEVLKTKVGVFVDLHKRTLEVQRQAEQLRLMEKAEHEERLAEAADRLEAQTKRNRFFSLSVDMLAIARLDGAFVQLNPAWEETFGYSAAEMKKLTIPDLVYPNDQPLLQEQIALLHQGRSIQDFECRCLCRDGTIRWLSWTAVPYPGEDLLYLCARDMTARKAFEKEIRSLNAELEARITQLTEINQELETFCYSISHDLRAPLRAMQGFSKALAEDYSQALDDAGRDFALRLGLAAQKMDQLIQDLLDYSRVARMDLKLSPVKLESALHNVSLQLATEIEASKAKIEVKTPLPEVHANSLVLEQALANLVSNALKFIPKNRTPHVLIWAEQIEKSVRLWIQDNGIGIAEEHQSRIFGLFERLHSTQEYPGTGIGLAIVRKAIERMGGKVGLTSSLQSGSCFWIDLLKNPPSRPSPAIPDRISTPFPLTRVS